MRDILVVSFLASYGLIVFQGRIDRGCIKEISFVCYECVCVCVLVS